MATTYTRRINLYINGKEVKNDIVSIRREMTKLTNEQARMTRGSNEYNKSAAKIKQLRGIMAEHNKALVPNNQKLSFFGRMAEGFNRFEQMTLAAVAALAGIAMVIKANIQAFADYDEALTDAMKTTGLTREEADEVSASLAKINTRTAQKELLDLAYVAGKLGITGKQAVLEFVEASDMIGVVLARDLGGTEEAIREIGKLTDIFHLKDLHGQREAILKVGSAINELGMASTATEAYMVNFSKRVAGVAPQAGVAIEDILGLAATLDALGQRSEMSSTAYSKLMVTMTKKTNEFASVARMTTEEFEQLFNADANEAMVRVFEGMNEDADGFQKIVSILGDLEIEGQRMTSVFGALAKNTKMLRAQQDLSNKSFEDGTSIIGEFNLKNETAQAKLDKYKKQFTAMQVEMGEKMMPLWGEVIKKASTLLKIIGISFEFLMKYGRTIISVAATIIAYSVATKIAVMWEERLNAAKGIGLALSKLSIFWNNAASAAMLLYQAAVAALAGNFVKAQRAMQLFWAFAKLNPIGLLVAGITALGLALHAYSQKLTAAQKLQKTLNDINLTAEQNIVEQRLQLEQLMRIAQDENNLTAQRMKAIQEINKISPEYLGNLKLETINTDEATIANGKYIESLRKKAQLLASQEKLVEIEKELLDLATGNGAEADFWQQTWNAIKTGGNVAAASMANANTAVSNYTNRSSELNLQKEKLLELNENIVKAELKAKQIVPEKSETEKKILEKQKELELARKMPGATDAESRARIAKISTLTLEIKELRKSSLEFEKNIDLIKEQEDLLTSANLMPASNEKEITARNQAIEKIEKRLAKLKELGTSKQGDSGEKSDDKAEKKKLEILEAANEKEKALIQQSYLDGITSEKQYHDELLIQKLAFLAGKLEIYKAGSKEYQEAVNEALELQVEVDMKLKELQLDAQRELADAKIENFRDEFIRQQKAEEQRWEDEKTALELRFIDKIELSDKEQVYNDSIYALIEEKEKSHQQKMRDLKSGQKISELEELVVAATPFDEEYAELDEMKLMFDAKKALIEEQFNQEKVLAAGNKAYLLAAEKRHNDAILQLKLDMIDAEWMQREQRIAAAQSFVGALSGIVDQETALGKALFLFSQGLAVAEIWMNVAKANAKTTAITPMPAAIPFIAMNTAVGVAQTAMVLAQTVKSFASPSKDKGYSDGGPTGPGGKNEPAGIVHKGEYVLSQDMLADPNVRYLTQIFEKMRTRKVSLSQAAMPLLSSGGFSSTNKSSSPSVISLPDSSNSLQQQNETNLELVKAIKLFLEYRPVVAVETIEREREKYIRIKQTSGL